MYYEAQTLSRIEFSLSELFWKVCSNSENFKKVLAE